MARRTAQLVCRLDVRTYVRTSTSRVMSTGAAAPLEKSREIQVGRLDEMPMKKRRRPGPGAETNGERVGRMCSVMQFGCIEVRHIAISYSL